MTTKYRLEKYGINGLYVGVCDQCGKSFTGTNKRRFCSDLCKGRYPHPSKIKRVKELKKLRIGWQLSTEIRKCPGCGESFTGAICQFDPNNTKQKRFCSLTCYHRIYARNNRKNKQLRDELNEITALRNSLMEKP